MTYKRLMEHIKGLSPKQLDEDVLVYNKSLHEFYDVKHFAYATADNNDHMEAEHAYLVFKL